MENKTIVFKKRDRELPIKDRKEPHCSHNNVEVDEDERVLSCATCGAKLSAFDWILREAKRETNSLTQIHHTKELIKKTKMEYFELQEEVQKLRAEKSRLKTYVAKINNK